MSQQRVAVTCNIDHMTGGGNCVYCCAIQQGRAEGERAATERIVKWLRTPTNTPEPGAGPMTPYFHGYIADAIERGEHHE